MTSSIDELLAVEDGRLGDVARCLLGVEQEATSDPQEIVRRDASANAGAASNTLKALSAIRDGEIPNGPTVARGALSATRAFLKRHRAELEDDAIGRLTTTIADLLEASGDEEANAAEAVRLQNSSAALADKLDQSGGVYVYTFPHYLRHPTIEESNRTLLKIGMSEANPSQRVLDQVRGAWVPEEPLVLRVIRSDDFGPRELEKRFHRFLDAAGHQRGGPGRTGREWFHTSLDFVDEIADQLGYSIERPVELDLDE